ncbi:MAG: hypothetical protein AAGI37_15355 [Planctomycetota bacterium]
MRPTHLILCLACLQAAGATPALGQANDGLTQDQRVGFRRLVAERNRLHQELAELDRQAADAVKAGRPTARLNARQIGVEDELDVVRLRLETTAVRLGLAVPEPPDPVAVDRKSAETGRRQLNRGVARTQVELRRQTRAILASLDFEPFLSGPMAEE